MAQIEPFVEKNLADAHVDESTVGSAKRQPVKWYRSTYYNAVILGLCNFCGKSFSKQTLGKDS